MLTFGFSGDAQSHHKTVCFPTEEGICFRNAAGYGRKYAATPKQAG
jgi:hypothetical protein